jgi:hypothetical protein
VCALAHFERIENALLCAVEDRNCDQVAHRIDSLRKAQFTTDLFEHSRYQVNLVSSNGAF